MKNVKQHIRFKTLRPFGGDAWIVPHCFDFITLTFVCDLVQKSTVLMTFAVLHFDSLPCLCCLLHPIGEYHLGCLDLPIA